MVIFKSRVLLHEVLPSHRRRFAITRALASNCRAPTRVCVHMVLPLTSGFLRDNRCVLCCGALVVLLRRVEHEDLCAAQQSTTVGQRDGHPYLAGRRALRTPF